MSIDREAWKKELLAHEELFSQLYDHLPKEYFFMRELLLSSLWRSPEHWGLAAGESVRGREGERERSVILATLSESRISRNFWIPLIVSSVFFSSVKSV